MQEFSNLWRKKIKQKVALICLTKDDHGKIELVGGNMTSVSEKGGTRNTEVST